MPSSSSNPPIRGEYSHIPIPTYEEAVASRPSSSQRNYLGPSEISHDAERQGLLGLDSSSGENGGAGGSSSRALSGNRGYRAPTVESVRSSIDDIDNLPSDDEDYRSAQASMEELRREMSEMEFEDSNGGGRTSGGRHKWSARGFASALNLNLNLNRIRLPRGVRAVLPSWEAVRSVLPRPPSREVLSHIKLDFSVVIRVFALAFIIGVAYLVFFSEVFRVRRPQRTSLLKVREFVRDSINEQRLRADSYYISSYDHIAGTEGSYVLGKWIQEEWTRAGIKDVSMDRYEVYLNYPNEEGRKVAIIEPEELRYTAELKEEAAYPGRNIRQAQVFHGHSANGNATGPLIYANYGSRDDFQRLKDMGIKVEGSIALMRYGGTEPDRALKVKAAELNGAIGALIYSDPADQDEKLPAFDGQWRFDEAVQRGTVSNMAMVVGDVLSPGFASTPEEKNRLSVDRAKSLGYLPNIPSIPLSWLDAKRLLESLKGIGKHLNDEAPEWVGGVPYVDWWTGGEGSPTVLLENNNDEELRQPIYNVVARIEGYEQPSAKVIVGNHRDAWCFGAVDPGSGTAVLMELVRVFGELLRLGWRPARTLEFVSWDAEEYNMIGSTEHVEANLDDLRQHGAAYINVDTAAYGSELWASASPAVSRAFNRALEGLWLEDEDRETSTSFKKAWLDRGSPMEPLGGGSDFIAFQDLAGVSSIDLGMRGSSFPYHSCHDTFDLVDGILDPGFKYHREIAQLIGLLILEFTDEPILQFDFEAYAASMEGYMNDLVKYAREKNAQNVDFGPLGDAIGIMKQAARSFRQWEEGWEQTIYQTEIETPIITAERVQHNTRAMMFEKDLLDLEEGGGIPGREQFKHVVFSPAQWQGYDAEMFVGIREPIERGDWEAAQRAIGKVASLIERASENLLK